MEKAKAKKGNIFIRILKFLFPWKGDSAGEVVRKIIFLISVAAIIVCLIYFGGRFQQRKNYSSTSDLTDLVGDSDSVNDDGSLSKYNKLLEINGDFVGWLKIEGVGVDVPVVQTKDNEAYLRKDFYGKYSVYGNPFLDYRNKLKKLNGDPASKEEIKRPDRNTVIYGHNMLDEMVFAELLQYKKLDFYKAHPVIEFDTIYGDTKWKIVSCFLTNSTAEQDNGYCFPYNFINCYDEKFASYTEELKKRSYINTGVDVNANDILLTLSTCDKDIVPEGRFAVVARLVRDGESAEVDVAKATENSNIKFPQGYYNVKGGANPYKDDARWQPYD